MSIKESGKKFGRKDFSKETRNIYHRQHMKIAEDEGIMKRFIDMFSHDYFGLEKDYFKGKRVLDSGCGDTGYLTIAMSKLGSTDLHGMDLDHEYMPVMLSIEEKFMRKLFDENKIKNVKRLRRFVKRRNIQKYLTPLHYENDHPISKIFVWVRNR